jgi:pimeloyl-ACP methyl ester carboxylesterase
MSVIVVCLIVLLGLVLGLWLWTQQIARTAERDVPLVGEICAMPGGRIHYVDLGPRDAPVLVLLHGLAGQLQHFTYALTDRLDQEFRLIVLDRPGCGYSTRAGYEAATLDAQASMVWAFLDKIGVENPWLVGHSLGGALSLQMALDQPGKTAGIVLLAPLTRSVSVVPDIFKGLLVPKPWLRKAIGNTISAPMGKLTADQVLAAAFAPDTRPSDFKIKGGAVLGLRPKGFMSASEDFNMVPHALERLEARYGDALPVPGGVLFGTEDALLPEQEHGAPMADLGLSYEALPGRGHMLPMVAPDETAAFVRRIVTQRPEAERAQA